VIAPELDEVERAYRTAATQAFAAAECSTAALICYAGAHTVATVRWLRERDCARWQLDRAVAEDPLASLAKTELGPGDAGVQSGVAKWLGQHWTIIVDDALDLLVLKYQSAAMVTESDRRAGAYRNAAMELVLEHQVQVAYTLVCGAIAEVMWRHANGEGEWLDLIGAAVIDPVITVASADIGLPRCLAAWRWIEQEAWPWITDRAEAAIAARRAALPAPSTN
jgi:hypothetical protein